MWRGFVAPLLLALGLFAAPAAVSAAKRPVFLYINTNFQNWSDPCIDIKHMVDNGVTHVIMAFLINGMPADAVLQWEIIGEAARKKCLDEVHAKGGKIMMATGGATEEPYHTDAVKYGETAAQVTMDLGFDGLDFDLEGLPPGFETSGNYYKWLVDSSKSARRLFNEAGKKDMVITHAPQTPYLTTWGGPQSGYVKLMKDLGDDVDHYLVQYYNQQACKYLDYDSIFVKTEGGCWAADGAVQEIKNILGDDSHLINKLVIGKPATIKDVYNTGFVEASALRDIICRAEKDSGYRGGVMGWSYRGPTDMVDFFANIGGEMCGGGGGGPTSTPKPAPITTPKPAPITTPKPAPITTPNPAPITTPKPMPITTPNPAPITTPRPMPTAPKTSTNKPPTPGGEACYHNEAGAWWEAECDSDKLCHLSDTESVDSCVSSGLTQPVIASSEFECREKLFSISGCGKPPTPTDPWTEPQPDRKECYVGLTWWAESCASDQLCRFDGKLQSEAACAASGVPLPIWAEDVTECRKIAKTSNACEK